MKRLYLDANIYLDFFDLLNRNTNKLLPAIGDVARNTFVTRQIVYEVNRNKVSRAKQACDQLREKLRAEMRIPEFLEPIIAKLPKQHRALGRPANPVLAKIEAAISAKIKTIAQSMDEVSLGLKSLFESAAIASEAELVAARLRKEVGNPPGKRSDPLGDQLTWEQLLSHVSAADDLWIVTRDTDYFIKDQGECLLHPVLLNDLIGKGLDPTKIYVFDSLALALQNFNSKRGVKVKKLPPKAILEGAAEEEQSMSSAMELQRWLKQSVTALPSPSRIVFVLGEIEGRSREEISEMIGIPEEQVVDELRAARLSLQREWSNHLNKGEKPPPAGIGI